MSQNITITIPQQPFVAYKNVTAFDNYVTRELKSVTGIPHCQLHETATMTFEVGDLLYRPQTLFTNQDIKTTIPNSPMTIVFEQYTKFKNP